MHGWADAIAGVNSMAQLGDTLAPNRVVEISGQDGASQNLPASARERFRRIRDQAENASHAARGWRERRDEISPDLHAAISHKKRLLSGESGLRHDPSSPVVAAQSAKVADLQAQYDRAHARFTEASQAAAPAHALVSSIEKWIQQHATRPLAEVPVEPITGKGEGHTTAIGRVRKQIAALGLEIDATRNAYLPTEIAKAKVDEDIDRIAQRGKCTFRNIYRQTGTQRSTCRPACSMSEEVKRSKLWTPSVSSWR
jgi:hypothetical protein